MRRLDDGAVVWDCPTCGSVAPLEQGVCPACATPLVGDPARQSTAPTRPSLPAGVDLRVCLALSVVLPGAGHMAAGQVGTGLARAMLYALWLPGGIVLALGRGPGGMAVAAPLLLGALALWLASAVDVLTLPAGGRQLADGRGLLWLVVAVTALMIVGAMAAVGTLGAAGSPAGGGGTHLS